METCAPFDAGQGYAIALTRYIDCQASLLGQDGYAALAASDSPIIFALGGLLTILIAFQGYRLLLGEQLQIRDAVLLVAKVGLVLAFATQWSAYRTVVYNLTVEAPREVMSLLPGAGGGTGRSLPARLQSSYQAIAELARPSNIAAATSAQPAQPGREVATAPAVPQNLPFSLVGNPVMIIAGIMLLVSGLAVLVSVRLVAGLLLALGPLFFACLLFDTTRGIFEGWVRALVGTAIASLTTGVILGVEMSIIEPQLGMLIDAMATGTLPVLAPGEILSTAIIFTLALLIAFAISLRVGSGFRFLPRGASLGAQMTERWRQASGVPVANAQRQSPQATLEERSRAVAIADAVRINGQREAVPAFQLSGSQATRRIEVSDVREGRTSSVPTTPLGQSHRRANSQRRTRSIRQRNGRT